MAELANERRSLGVLGRDGTGARIAKCETPTSSPCTSAAAGTLFWRDIAGNTLAESDLSGNITKEYIYFAGQRVAWRDASSGAVFYYYTDQIETVRRISDQNGNTCYSADFTPYGQEIYTASSSCEQNYKFAGYERDSETGLDYAFARYYNSRLGRFISPDPFGGNGSGPQSLNRYAYVSNNPINRIDPSGMLWCLPPPAGSPYGLDSNCNPHETGWAANATDMWVDGAIATFCGSNWGNTSNPTDPTNNQSSSSGSTSEGETGVDDGISDSGPSVSDSTSYSYVSNFDEDTMTLSETLTVTAPLDDNEPQSAAPLPPTPNPVQTAMACWAACYTHQSPGAELGSMYITFMDRIDKGEEITPTDAFMSAYGGAVAAANDCLIQSPLAALSPSYPTWATDPGTVFTQWWWMQFVW